MMNAEADESEVSSSFEPKVEVQSQCLDHGLNLVHLLLACAEAVGCKDTNLAHSMINQIWGSVGPWGYSFQRETVALRWH